MKVLLTGASGFVGSHILDRLVRQGIRTAVLLRTTSNRRFIEPVLSHTEVRDGTISDPASLRVATDGVTHVIHCAGSVKALRHADFFEVNQVGTRNVVEAANRAGVQRLVHISSLAAAGPGTPDSPARESDPPRPVSVYGRSKLAGENEVRDRCKTDFVIVRPPAVYGPRDGEFLRMFKAVHSGWLPDIGCGRQALSLVYVEDLADAVVECLQHPQAGGKTFFAANDEVTSALRFGKAVAEEMKVRARRLPVPVPLLWPACWGQEILSRLTSKPNVLSAQKYAELRAPGWVCDPSRLRNELGITCATNLHQGVKRTVHAYRETGWL